MKTIPVSSMRQVCGLILDCPMTTAEMARDLNWTVTEAQAALDQAVTEGWALKTSGIGKAVRYRATHRPAYCTGGWVPPGPGDRRVGRHARTTVMAKR
jgi:hypothetical protein